MKLANLKTPKKAKPYRVLVLEDDMELSTVIERILRSIDSTIDLDWATSTEGAVARLEELLQDEHSSPYDLIVADIFLHGKSTGIDFWRMCQELFPDIPVLITSALTFDRFFATIGRHSISPPYLQKPFTAVEGKQMFETMLRFSLRDRGHVSNSNGWFI